MNKQFCMYVMKKLISFILREESCLSTFGVFMPFWRSISISSYLRVDMSCLISMTSSSVMLKSLVLLCSVVT